MAAKARAKAAKVDFDRLDLAGLERLLNVRQKKFVAFLLTGISQTEAAVLAGYSQKTAASQASDLLKSPKVSAYRRALTRAMLDSLCLTPEAIALRLFEIYERCMAKSPVLEWNSESRAWVPSGLWQFDARGATRVLELLGKNSGMFSERVQVSGSVGGLEEFISGFGKGVNDDAAPPGGGAVSAGAEMVSGGAR